MKGDSWLVLFETYERCICFIVVRDDHLKWFPQDWIIQRLNMIIISYHKILTRNNRATNK